MEKEHGSQDTSRRKFFLTVTRLGAAALFARAAVPAFLAAAPDKQDSGKTKAIASVVLAEKKELSEVGGFVMLKGTSAGDILIVRATDKDYSVLNPICPHKQCTVKVKSTELIQCPCHKSRYAIDGTYESGPSKKSLGKYAYTIKDGVLTVLASE